MVTPTAPLYNACILYISHLFTLKHSLKEEDASFERAINEKGFSLRELSKKHKITVGITRMFFVVWAYNNFLGRGVSCANPNLLQEVCKNVINYFRLNSYCFFTHRLLHS